MVISYDAVQRQPAAVNQIRGVLQSSGPQRTMHVNWFLEHTRSGCREADNLLLGPKKVLLVIVSVSRRRMVDLVSLKKCVVMTEK